MSITNTISSSNIETWLSSDATSNVESISLPLFFTFHFTNSSNSTISSKQLATSSLVTTQHSEYFAYNSGNNIVYYVPEVIMHDNPLNKSLKRITEIRNLGENWNGYGAEPFSTSFLFQLENFIRSLSKQPDIYPTAQSSIQLEYYNDNGDYLEFEFFTNEEINQFILKSNGETISRKGIPHNTINEVIDWFYGQ